MEKNTETWKLAAAIAGVLLALAGLTRAMLAGKRSARKPVEDTVLYTI